MKNHSQIILAIIVLALAALACQTVMGGGSTPTLPPIDTAIGTEVFPTALPTETQSGTANVILSDDFSSVQWGTGTDADSSVEYANEALQMIIPTKNWFVWSTPPGNSDYHNIHMEVTVINNGTDSTTGFGLLCNQQATRDNYHYVAITPAGRYAIGKASEGQSDLFLTNDDQWAFSDLIAQNAASYRVGADCTDGILTLYVDGQQIASVSDSSYTSGRVGVFTWSGKDATNTDVSFDDFLMTELP